MTRVGVHVFVSIQRVNRNFIPWSPVGASYLVVIDAYTYQVVDADPLTAGIQPLRLTGANPYSELVVDPVNHQIIVSTVGRWNIADGGLERVNPSALSTGAFALTESQAGGEITDVVMVDANRGAAIVTDASFNNLVIGFDFTAPADIDTIYAPGSFAMQDAELSPDGLLFVTDRTPVAPGIRVFRSDTWSQLTTSPIDVGLPPFDIEFGRR